MRQIRQLRQRVESIEDELGIEPSSSDSSGEYDDGPRLKSIIGFVAEESTEEAGASIETVLNVAVAFGTERSKAEHELEKLRRQGEVYEVQTGYLRRT